MADETIKTNETGKTNETNKTEAPKKRKRYEYIEDDRERNQRAYEIIKETRDDIRKYLFLPGGSHESYECIDSVLEAEGVNIEAYQETIDYVNVIKKIIEEAWKLSKDAYDCFFDSEGRELKNLESSLRSKAAYGGVLKL